MEHRNKQRPARELTSDETKQVEGGLIENPLESPPDPEFPDCIPAGPVGGGVPLP